MPWLHDQEADRTGSLGFTFHELAERGEDGTWRYKFDMFGLR